MATIKKVTLHDLSSIGHIFQAMLKRIESKGTAQDLHLVYDTLNIPLKKCERMRRVGDNAPLEYVDLSMKSQYPCKQIAFGPAQKTWETFKFKSKIFQRGNSKLSYSRNEWLCY